MNILLAADIFPPQTGGPATYVVALANALREKGEYVKIVTLNPDADVRVTQSTYSVTHGNKVYRYAQYVYLLWKHSADADVIYAMGPVNAGLPAFIVSRIRQTKFVVKVVGDYAWEQGVQRYNVDQGIDAFQVSSNPSLAVKTLRFIQALVVKNAHLVIVPSQYLQTLVRGWGAERVEAIYNAVAIPDDKHDGDKRERLDDIWLVTVARLVPWKGMIVLIDVMHRLKNDFPGLQLTIIGDGPSKKDIESHISRLALHETVHLLGACSRNETLSHMRQADAFILNSGYEGLSHAILEAMMLGTFVLASNSSGNPELIRAAGTGTLFAYNDRDDLEKAIRTFLIDRPNGRPSEDFFETFSFDTMMNTTQQALRQICNS